MKKSNFVSYEDCKNFVKQLGIKTKSEWKDYCKLGKRPKNIPSNPNQKYEKEWEGWGNFLGTGAISNHKIEMVTYTECEAYARSLRLNGNPLKSQKDWYKYHSNYKKPDNIPYSPQREYKKEDFSWGEFLNTGLVATFNKVYRSFEDCKEFVKPLGLKSLEEWRKYCKGLDKPKDIPANPDQVFHKKGWVSYPDFLGYLGNGNIWTRTNIIAYLEDIQYFLHVCSIPQLLTIISSNGLIKHIKSEDIDKLKDSLPNTNDRIDLVRSIISDIKSREFTDDVVTIDNEELIDGSLYSMLDTIYNQQVQDQDLSNEGLTLLQLKSIDNPIIIDSLDVDKIDFIRNDFINNIWYDIFNNSIEIKSIQDTIFTNELPSKIKEDFINEYNKVINLQLPKKWKYHHEPLLMQKLIAYRLYQKRKYANWSSVGSGKTISAILAGEYVGSKNTLVITSNSTIGNAKQRGWIKEIKDSIKDVHVISKEDKSIKFKKNKTNYVVLNYETFQQKTARSFVNTLLNNVNFDYIILDEVQNIKKTNKSIESKRRAIILDLINKVSKKTPDFHLLIMSATPIINNLPEAKSLLELIYPNSLDVIKTIPTINNCLEIFQRITNCGIRYKNKEEDIMESNKFSLLNVNGDHLFSIASKIKNDHFLSIDQLLIKTKLNAVLPYINKSNGKTIIYTYYVDKIENYIYDYLTSLGYKVGVYTGSKSKHDREASLDSFINGEYDILLGSKPLATGIDGLQKVSDTLIILSLPWTYAEVVHLIGRIRRKGSNFIKTGIQVIIPLVTIKNNEESYNWDEYRYFSINYKKTISNVASDGMIPDDFIPSNKKLIKKSETSLIEWIERLKEQRELV